MEKPILRFKGYNDNWGNYSFKDILLVNSGKDYKNCKAGNIPVYGTGGYMLSIDKSLCSEDAIGIGRKGSIDKPQYLKAPFWTIDTLFFLTLKKEFDLVFLYYMANLIEWRKLDESTGVPSLSKENIDKIRCKIPCISEQHLISRYFSLLDSKINTISKEIQCLYKIKSACLQSMFPQEGESVPKVRFKGFNEEWKKDKLCKFVTRITRKNKDLESNLPLTISAADGLVSQLQYFNNIVASANLSGYYLIKNGEFAYNKSYSNGYPFGSIKRLDKYDMGALSTLYIVFGLKNNSLDIDSDYLTTFFSTTLWHHEVAERAEEGARNHGLLNIGAGDFLDINIFYPKDIAEQQKIAAYFENLDRQISLQTQRLEKLKQIKSSCLDTMFV